MSLWSPFYCEFTSIAVLEQCGPDVIITSSKADDNFMDVLRDHSTSCHAHIWYTYMIDLIVDASGGAFQVRPHKDFSAVKGRDRILSLRLLSELPVDRTRDARSPGSDGTSEPRSAYEFMRRRQEVGGDPTMQRWNASIRLANHASLEATPLCVSCISCLNPNVALHYSIS